MACGVSCPVACGILVPQTGIKPVSPALLTTGLPGKSLHKNLKLKKYRRVLKFISLSVSGVRGLWIGY